MGNREINLLSSRFCQLVSDGFCYAKAEDFVGIVKKGEKN
jgi:hypothetical protein